MLKHSRTFLAWACFVFVIAVLALIGAHSSSFQKCAASYESDNAQNKHSDLYERIPRVLVCEGAFIDENSGTLTALATIAIAAFTLTLWRATDKLWGNALEQARTAERAYTELERPYLYMEFPSSGFLIDGIGVTRSGNFILRCVNHGRTPADITQLVYGHSWLPRGKWPEPYVPEDWSLGRNRPPGTVAAPNGGFYEETTNPWGMVAPDQLVEFYHDRGSIFVTGYVRYADAFGAHHITGFNAALGHLGEGFVLRGDVRYNYTRTERDRPMT
jgi:hypothetical protein